jgi:hypothetical protein
MECEHVTKILEVECWPLVPKFVGSNPAEAVRFFQGEKKILSTPSFGGEVKAVLSHVADLRHVKEA